jgi:hypothetical protein
MLTVYHRKKANAKTVQALKKGETIRDLNLILPPSQKVCMENSYFC